MQLRFSRLAEADIEAIGDFIALDNPARAISFIAELRHRCRTLLHFPYAHAERPEIAPGMRIATFGRYLLLHVIDGQVLEIRRVLHGARDLPRAAQEP